MGAAQAREAASRPATRRCTRRRSAGGWSTRRCPEQWTISLGESAEKLADIYDDLARGAGRVRAAQPHARRAGLGRGLLRLRSSRSPAPSSSATRASAPTPRWRSWRKLKPAFVEGGTVTAGNSSPLNDGAVGAAARRRGGAGRSARAAGPDRLAAASTGSTPTSSASRPVEAANKRARAGRHHLGRHRRGRAQRGLRLAVPGLPRRAGRTSTRRRSTRSGGAIAIGHPLGASGARVVGRLPRSCARAAAATASPPSASASARGWRWCWRSRVNVEDRTGGAGAPTGSRRETLGAADRTGYDRPAGYRATAPAHDPAPRRWSTLPHDAHRADRAAARRRPGRRDRTTTSPPARRRAAGQRIILHGRVLDGDGRPVRDTLVEIWQANAAGRYWHAWDNHPAPLDPHFDGRRPLPHRRRRAATASSRSGPAPIPGATTSTPGAPPTSTSRCSAAPSPSGW